MAEALADKLQRLATEQSKSAGRSTAKQTQAAADAAGEQRRARTHRLVQIGALADRYLGTARLTPPAFETLLAELAALPEVQALLGRE